MKGVHQKASGGRIIATAPAGSGNAARPVPGRTRDTDHRQRCSRASAAGAGAEKRGAARHHYSFRKYRADVLPGRLSAGDIPPVIPPPVAQYRRIR
ncbi:hypothetical protein FPE53_22595 [Salmonella enterica subsp. enterica]|uniref:Uncharacterized protein n=1 Tax=Salmonella enterica subsp. enterica serovar Aqua TaxID=1302615 RepID=A0A5X6ESK6_SALET|nr:hypothetical protein [Salmonella enterica subsp. enterica serovar Aqua]ECH1171992.1 hypothetical protein [Salmonella enterica subsp. enterica serovar Aqua]